MYSSPGFRVTRTRPNGKQYSAFKEPKAFVLDAPDGDLMVLVIRCDDYELARTLGGAELTYVTGERMKAVNPVFGWWRESIRDNCRYWVYDDVTGAPGYFFTRVEDCE
jgi:hypothetical protein